MGQHNVPRGEKSSYGNSNGSPIGVDGTVKPDYSGRHRAAETTPLNDRGNTTTTQSLFRIPGFLKGK